MSQPGNHLVLQCISPIDGTVFIELELVDSNAVSQSIELSRLSQKQWQLTSLVERARIWESAFAYFETKQAQIAEEIAWQMGRPVAFAGGEVNGLAERARHMIAIAEQSLADVVPEAKAELDRFIRSEPVGTVFTITSWNYPLLTSVNSIVPAILAGNTALLNASAQVPLWGEHFAQAFRSAGLPEGVFQNLFLSHEDTERIVNSGQMNFICLPGSVPAGQRIEKAAAGTFADVALELGGKDPAYVKKDANFDDAVKNPVDGAFFNSGQSCYGNERIYVHETPLDTFVEAYVERVKQYSLTNPLQGGGWHHASDK